MTRAFPAKGLILILTDSRGDPYAALTVHGEAMGVRLTRPDCFVAEVRRRFCRLCTAFARCVRIANRQFHLTRRVAHGIYDRHVIRSRLESPVNRAIRIDGRVPL